MSTETNPLMLNKGMLIKQHAQTKEWFLKTCCVFCSCCFEFDNKYYVSAMPSDEKALRGLKDGQGWKPTQSEMNKLHNEMIGVENSKGCAKCVLGLMQCGGFRGFELNFTEPNAGTSFLKLNKETTLGGRFCCPHNMEVYVNGQKAGRVIEDWKCENYLCSCANAAFFCKVPYDIQGFENGEFVNKYRINVNFCACGPHFNFCGSTICRNDMLWDVLKVNDGNIDESEPVGYIQKTYGGCSSIEAFTRGYCCGADNFIIDWPENATAEDRALFMATATLFEYVYFESQTPRP